MINERTKKVEILSAYQDQNYELNQLKQQMLFLYGVIGLFIVSAVI